MEIDVSSVRPRQLWKPQPDEAKRSALGQFASDQGFDVHEYDSLWRWSVARPSEYWSQLWQFAGLRGSLGSHAEATAADMAGTRFFDAGQLNVAENLLSAPSDTLAVVEADAKGRCQRWTFGELRNEVEIVAAWLRRNGVCIGDVVATVVPNRFEALVSFLATSAVGGVWTSCAPELSAEAIIDRIGQVSPKVLFSCDAYVYNGKRHAFKETSDRLVMALPDLKFVVVVDRDGDTEMTGLPGSSAKFIRYREVTTKAEEFEWRRFPFNCPGLVMYTSGTTGKPKAIVHSAGGVLLKLTSEHAFHVGIGAGDVVFWYTNTAWMMFHWLAYSLVRGNAIVLYEDAPVPNGDGELDLGALWRIADAAGVTVMGISPSYISVLQDGRYSPQENHSLTRLHTIMAAGSPVSAEQFEWVYANVSASARFCPISGGTELMSSFVGGSPLHPVFAGEMSCKCLGMAVDIFDERGVSVVGKKGELVCTEPFPSMPLTFWGADGDARYHAAYFERYPKVWTHGDLAEQTLSGGFVIYGRSDTTLNPGGVRIGTAEIYRPLTDIPAIEAAVVFGRPIKNSEEIVLCVKLSNGAHLDKDLATYIRSVVRSKASPRHVPHAIYQVDDVPFTQNGKLVEAAAKAAAISFDVSKFSSLRNPECLVQFTNLAERDAL